MTSGHGRKKTEEKSAYEVAEIKAAKAKAKKDKAKAKKDKAKAKKDKANQK